MTCVSPITLKDGRSVPCGRCFACLANRQRDWTFRLDLEKDNCSFFLWITLTYDDAHLPRFDDGRPMVYKSDCRQFFERLRKRFPEIKFKHFLVSEYGPTPSDGVSFRPHYHTILFCNVNSTNAAFVRGRKREVIEYLDSAWGKGFAYNKAFHNRVFSYVSKYCCKPDLLGMDVPVKVFTLISQGIGASGLDQFDFDSLVSRDYQVGAPGHSRVLPRYLRDKVETQVEMELLERDPNAYLEQLAVRKVRRTVQSFERYNRCVNLAVSYEQKHGTGSYSRKELSKIELAKQRFINKLKERQNG